MKGSIQWEGIKTSEQRTKTSEFKLEAVQLAQKSGKSQAQMARDLGIADSTLHNWCPRIGRSRSRGFSRQWTSDPTRRRAASSKARTGSNTTGARHIKKSTSHFLAQPTLSYPFIAEQAKVYPVSTMCRVLGVSVSGYYDWRGREPSANAREDGELAKRIHQIISSHRSVYGSPRVHAELRAQGIRCSKERVARLMREMELVAKRRRNKPVGTLRRNGARIAPNELNRDFSAIEPNTKWGSSTTFVWTREGWLYVAVILDLFSRLVVGWAMQPSNDEELVTLAFQMAVSRRSPAPEMLVHSEEARPYTSTGYLARLAEAGVVVSMSRTGDCYDNAAMESFFSTLPGRMC